MLAWAGEPLATAEVALDRAARPDATRAPRSAASRAPIAAGADFYWTESALMTCDRDVAPGLWSGARLSRLAPGGRLGAVVASTCVDSGGEVALIDPLAPPDEATEVWERLDAKPPTPSSSSSRITCATSTSSSRRYDARAFGPWLFWRANIPETELEPIEPGSELPGGLVALYDGRGRNETPLWLPEQRALVFADG